MSPVANQPKYYAEDFEPQASPALQFFCGVLLTISALVCGFMAGMEFSDFLHREAKKAEALKPRPAAVKPRDPLSVYCANKPEFHRVCLARRTAI